tara:strand:+ start:650 stop:859 length:210 start_codon:yes stop_codon:yes gene_type:complete
MAADPISVTLIVTHALERFGVPYVISGSVASAVHGVVRTTVDAGRSDWGDHTCARRIDSGDGLKRGFTY